MIVNPQNRERIEAVDCTGATYERQNKDVVLGGKCLTMSPTQVVTVCYGSTIENTATFINKFILVSKKLLLLLFKG